MSPSYLGNYRCLFTAVSLSGVVVVYCKIKYNYIIWELFFYSWIFIRSFSIYSDFDVGKLFLIINKLILCSLAVKRQSINQSINLHSNLVFFKDHKGTKHQRFSFGD